MKKLLATTSFLALAASPAYAQLMLTPGDPNSTAAAAELSTDWDLAEEADLTGTELNTFIGLRLSTAGVIPPGQNVFLTLNLTGGTFTTALTGAEITQGATGAVVDSGGGAGGSSVRYLVTTDAGATAGTPGGKGDSVGIRLPISFGGCPMNHTPAPFSVNVSEFETEAVGTVIEGGMASLMNDNTPPVPTDFYIRCVDAFQASLTDDGLVAGGVDTKLDFSAIPPLSKFVVSTTASAPFTDDTATTAELGFFSLTINTAARRDLSTPVPTAVALGDATGFETTINFPGTDTGITSCDVNPVAGALFDTGGVVGTAADACVLGSAVAATATPATGLLSIIVPGTTSIAEQDPFATMANTLLDTGDGYKAKDAFLSTSVDDLDPNSLDVGFFDWVGQQGSATRNIFRVTGLPAGPLPVVRVDLKNSSAGLDGECALPLALAGKQAAFNVGQELIINQADLSAACGNFGRADVLLKFFTPGENDFDFDVDRLLATGGDNIVSDFGNQKTDETIGEDEGFDGDDD